VVLRGNAEVGSVIAITRSGSTVGTATTDTNGAWQATLSANLTANAANALVVTATDKAGNTATTNYSLTHDNTAPSTTLVVTSPSNASLMPTVSGTGAEANAFVEVYSGSTLLGAVQANSAGIWSVQLASITTSGSYTLTAKQRDAAGNLSSNSTSLTLNVSDGAPVVINQAPTLTNINLLAADDTGTVGDNITTLGAPRFSGTGALANATIKLWEGNTLLGTTSADSAGAWIITPTATLTSGVRNLGVTQQGAGQSASNAFTYAATILTTLAAPAINANMAGNDSVSWAEAVAGSATVSGTGVNGATVSVKFTNAANQSVTKTATVASGTWSVTSLSAAELASLGAGNVTLSASQSLAGVTSGLTSRTIAIESLAAPAINANIAGDDIVSLSEVTGPQRWSQVRVYRVRW